jgi:hypothetical protein
MAMEFVIHSKLLDARIQQPRITIQRPPMMMVPAAMMAWDASSLQHVITTRQPTSMMVPVNFHRAWDA